MTLFDHKDQKPPTAITLRPKASKAGPEGAQSRRQSAKIGRIKFRRNLKWPKAILTDCQRPGRRPGLPLTKKGPRGRGAGQPKAGQWVFGQFLAKKAKNVEFCTDVRKSERFSKLFDPKKRRTPAEFGTPNFGVFGKKGVGSLVRSTRLGFLVFSPAERGLGRVAA